MQSFSYVASALAAAALATAGCDTCEEYCTEIRIHECEPPISVWSAEMMPQPYGLSWPGLGVSGPGLGESTVVLEADGGVQFGDQFLDCPHLATFTADGELVALAPIPFFGACTSGASMLGMGAPGPVVAQTSEIIAFDQAFTPRWAFTPDGSYVDALAVGLDGTVAFIAIDWSNDVPTVPSNSLHVLGPDGVERWQVSVPLIAGTSTPPGYRRIAVLDDGDVVTFYEPEYGGPPQRTRYAAADGAVVEHRDLDGTGHAILISGDGGMLLLAPFAKSTGLTRINPDGTAAWVDELYLVTQTTAAQPAILAGNDLVVAAVPYHDGPTIFRIDDTTGDVLQQIDNCSGGLVNADATGYVTFGGTMTVAGSSPDKYLMSPALARFAWP